MSQAGILSEDTTPLANVETLTGNVGGAVGPDAAHNINLLGVGGVVVTGTPATNTLSVSFGLVWTREIPAAVALVSNQGFTNANAGLTTFALPAVSTVGDMIMIAGEGAGGWTIAQNAGQNIQIGNISSAIGIGGSVSSTNLYDSITLVCRVANTTWQCMSHEGVFNIV